MLGDKEGEMDAAIVTQIVPQGLLVPRSAILEWLERAYVNETGSAWLQGLLVPTQTVVTATQLLIAHD